MRFHICLTAIAAIIVPSIAAGQSFSEDFSTDTYRDVLATTADWNTAAGELRLFPFSPTLVGSLDTPGNASEIAVAGDYAYIADALEGLRILDIRDRSNPAEVGFLNTPGVAGGVAVASGIAYVADSQPGVLVVDVSNPASPFVIGVYNPASFPGDVSLHGDHAFVAVGTSGVDVLDISDPTTPTLVGSFNTSGTATRTVVEGDLCFVADWAAGLVILDISNPAAPTLVGSFDTPGNALDVAVSGNLALVADNAFGVQVIDIADPAAPSLLGTLDTAGNAFHVAISGERAYVGDRTNGLVVIDLSDPTNPTALFTHDTPAQAQGLVVGGEFAFVADGTSGLQIIRVAEAMAPSQVGVAFTSSALGVAVAGAHAFVADATSGLRVYDVSNPSTPVQVALYSSPDLVRSVQIDGDLAYIADSYTGVQILDISDPANPSLLGAFDTPVEAFDVFVSGDVALVADSPVMALDVSDPTNPVLLDTHSASASSVFVEGNLAFLCRKASGLEILDFENPSNLTLLGTFTNAWSVHDVFAAGNLAYVANGLRGLAILDVTDPNAPVQIGSLDTPGNAVAVAVSGNLAYVADGIGQGSRLIDVTDPTAPFEVGANPTTGQTLGIALSGQMAYQVCSNGPLEIFRFLQDDVRQADRTGRSLRIDEGAGNIMRARLTASQTSGVAWELSANGGTNFQSVVPGGPWTELAAPGADLRWRSTLSFVGAKPSVSSLEIDWLREAGRITAIADIPNDQGKQVRVEWRRSGHDFVGDPSQIVEYALYRRIEPGFKHGAEPDRAGLSPAAREHAAVAKKAGWDFLVTVPVRAQDDYAVVAPTLADSTTSGHLTTFMVSALTATPGVFYDSPPDSGYSLDNLAPGVPLAISADYEGGGVTLDWNDAPEPDLQFFRVYRASHPEFVPSPASLVGEVAVSRFTDPTAAPWIFFYKITAVDFAGNESEPGSPQAMTAAPDRIQRVAELHAPFPNPFNPSTTLSFTLPARQAVRLNVFDVAGRLVSTLLDEVRPAGRHQVTWPGHDSSGSSVASGAYIVRLQAGSVAQSRRLVLLK